MRINVLLTAAAFFILLALPQFSIAQRSPGQGEPARLELKPFPVPSDGIVRCKSGDELQIQLVGYDSTNTETTLNQWRPTASSSNTSVATAEVPAHTGHQVRVKCVADGRATITASYKQVSASLTLQVGSGVQTTSEPSPDSDSAQMSCEDFKDSNPDYNEKMDELAKLANLPDNYWSRYHKDVVRDLCSGNIKGVDEVVDSGVVKLKEVQSIARVLGKSYKPKPRTETGKKYEYARNRFEEMLECGACADQIARYYAKKPVSRCGILAKQALAGDRAAIKKLKEFPNYCEWK